MSGCLLSKTVFVYANLTDVRIDNVDKDGAYLKYAKLKGTAWQVAEQAAT